MHSAEMGTRDYVCDAWENRCRTCGSRISRERGFSGAIRGNGAPRQAELIRIVQGHVVDRTTFRHPRHSYHRITGLGGFSLGRCETSGNCDDRDSIGCPCNILASVFPTNFIGRRRCPFRIFSRSDHICRAGSRSQDFCHGDDSPSTGRSFKMLFSPEYTTFSAIREVCAQSERSFSC